MLIRLKKVDSNRKIRENYCLRRNRLVRLSLVISSTCYLPHPYLIDVIRKTGTETIDWS